MIVAGIDGGQSGTLAVVIEQSGRVRGWGSAGPADHVGEAADSSRAAEACEAALGRALLAGRVTEPLGALVVGLSGYDGTWHGRLPDFGTTPWRAVHDAPIALAGAVAERPAVVVIAGSGSVGYGEDAGGVSTTVGGWGYLFGDEGSAFALARAALSAAMRAQDRGGASTLGVLACGFFEVRSLHALVRAVSVGAIWRPKLASFAQAVVAAANEGDDDARAVVHEATEALAALGALTARRTAPGAPVVFVGGLLTDGALRERVHERSRALGLRVIRPRYGPAVGAAFLAFDLAATARPVEVFD